MVLAFDVAWNVLALALDIIACLHCVVDVSGPSPALFALVALVRDPLATFAAIAA